MIGYSFQFISDERSEGTKDGLESMDQSLKCQLSQFGLYASLIEVTGIRELWFHDNRKQWRKDYIIIKNGRVITWNEIFAKINSIQAPVYKRCTE